MTEPTVHLCVSDNRRSRPPNATIDTLVVHAMGEYILDANGEAGPKGAVYYAPDWLERIGLSCHVLIPPDGSILDCVDPLYVAWHAKRFNYRSLGAEFLVSGEHDIGSLRRAMADVEASPYTDRQYAAGGFWYAGMAKQFDLDFEDIKAHSWLDPTRKEDPGDAFDWTKFKAEFFRWREHV